MALLTQTADRVDYFYSTAAGPFGGYPYDGLARLEVSQAVISGGTATYAATTIGAVNRARVLPQSFIAPLAVWQAQSSWPIGINVILSFGTLVNPPAGSKRVSGYFQDQNGVGIGRVGFLMDRSTGAFLASFNSSAVDGSFNGYVPTTNPVLAVLIPSGADSRNAVVMDNLTPV